MIPRASLDAFAKPAAAITIAISPLLFPKIAMPKTIEGACHQSAGWTRARGRGGPKDRLRHPPARSQLFRSIHDQDDRQAGQHDASE